ncbi:MAG: FKBP-type peptidyl-prolyl cis-trans isomerase, partial [Cyanobacteria bacterium M_surface_9_m1_291]|nr:FKBP-type peptidyl-prolyl cis-trans isomerase [Cyanobacteria bacterium M_surface_9_m1_291]
MRDILISSAVCVICLMVALVSQLVAPTTVAAAPPAAQALEAPASPTPTAPAAAKPAGRLELDPDDPNPTLFAMA